MTTILVAGLVNLETTLLVDAFPIAYSPVRYPFFGVESTPSGVGLNVAAALTTLGDAVRLLSLVGTDLPGRLVTAALADRGVDTTYVLPEVAETAQSVILSDGEGRRQANTDLKDLQDRIYPPALFDRALAGCSLAVLTNINFSRPLLARARRAGVPIACDVHAISSLDDPYNADFMRQASILFMSHEQLPVAPEAWVAALQQRYSTEIVVIGMGEQGALLAQRGKRPEQIPAVLTRPIAGTIGAGDALFSSFVHFHAAGLPPRGALCRAVVFASYKIGERGGAAGFLDEASLDRLYHEVSARAR